MTNGNPEVSCLLFFVSFQVFNKLLITRFIVALASVCARKSSYCESETFKGFLKVPLKIYGFPCYYMGTKLQMAKATDFLFNSLHPRI